jgi:hypothetical protein
MVSDKEQERKPSMLCPQCNQAIDADASFCGYCGNQLAPINVQRSAVADEEKEELYLGNQRHPHFDRDKGFPAVSWDGVEESPVRLSRDTPPYYASRPSSVSHKSSAKRRFNAFVSILIALLLIGLSAGAIALAQNGQSRFPLSISNSAAAIGPEGSVLFSASPGQEQTDTISVTIKGLKTLPHGSQYDVWLIDEQEEHTHLMGALDARGNNFVLNFAQPDGGNLFGEGNEITVTQETANVLSPTNKPLLIARFPPLAFIHIRHLLYHFDSAPQGIALLVGLEGQASLVNEQAQTLQQVSGENNPAAVRCVAQNLLNLLEGDQGPNFQQLPVECQQNDLTQPGDGFGLLDQSGYIETAAAHASLAATAPDATPTVKMHATKVENALSNVKGWLTTVDNDAQAVLNHPDDNARIQEIVTQASNALNGMNINKSNVTDPAPGDAGVATALLQGRLMASLALQPA